MTPDGPADEGDLGLLVIVFILLILCIFWRSS
jgi:hypothetical protein